MSDYEYQFHKRWAMFYANEAIMRRIDAVAFVEGKDDKPFWHAIFEHAGLRVNVITGTNNVNNKGTCGKQECLKYFLFASKKFIVCIDSDYDYLRNTHPEWNPHHYLLQTYTYAIENHYLASNPALHDFLREYSHVIYYPFLRHMHNYGSVNEFCMRVAPYNGHYGALHALQHHITNVYAPKPENPFAACGLTPDNTYLYIKAKVLTGRLQCGSRLRFDHFPMAKIFADIAVIFGR
jgi:hypothetical protein